MNQKQTDIANWLQTEDTPSVPTDRMEALISAGTTYINGSDFNKNSFRSTLLSLLQYLPVSFWTIHAVLAAAAVCLICLLGHWRVPFYYPLTVLAILIPLLVLLGVREISKSSLYDMWEIEQSSRCQLTDIIACRMLIIGLFDLLVVTGILLLMSRCYQQSLIGMILYGTVPFNISCTCYFFTITRAEKKDLSYHLIACMICLAAAFSFLLKQQFLFEASMLWGWSAFYLISVLLLFKTVRAYLKHEKMIGELSWNLQ